MIKKKQRLFMIKKQRLFRMEKGSSHTFSFDSINIAIRACEPPLGDYVKLARRAIPYAQGLPLALKVFGCCPCGGSIDNWEDALDGFKNKEIQDVLEISDLKEVQLAWTSGFAARLTYVPEDLPGFAARLTYVPETCQDLRLG
ncbi:hypothetical protein L3X38_021906 [Prunus dulcis]|uniref:Uncharacterized protein n=1 Tax=Prunus dulcis TaxID=3755 RepID=A0AAD4Z3T3_PRUDU|nr:hypothetical protein L3X38_021906 [Prunus dulcis]